MKTLTLHENYYPQLSIPIESQFLISFRPKIYKSLVHDQENESVFMEPSQLSFNNYKIKKCMDIHISSFPQRLINRSFLFTVIIVSHEISFQKSSEVWRYEYSRLRRCFKMDYKNALQYSNLIRNARFSFQLCFWEAPFSSILTMLVTLSSQIDIQNGDFETDRLSPTQRWPLCFLST